MIFSIKRLAFAAALATVAGSASAAGITAGDLVELVYDPITTQTYIRDIGATGAGLTAPFSLTGDANWTSFYKSGDGDIYDVFSSTGASTTTIDYVSDANGKANPVAPSQLFVVLGDYNALQSNVVQLTYSATNSAISGVSLVGSSSDFAYITLATTLAFPTDGAVGTSLSLEKMANARGNVVTPSVLGNGAEFTLGTNGTLTYATAAAVPEPGTWALMVAGLLAVGSIARRRNAAI